MEKVVYVAGPYTADTDFVRMQNIRSADDVTAKLWSIGAFALCPHKITAFYGGLREESVFIEGGLELLRRCDAVVLVEGWENSGGTLGEIKEALKLSIPVYRSVIAFVRGYEIERDYVQQCIDKWEESRREKNEAKNVD